MRRKVHPILPPKPSRVTVTVTQEEGEAISAHLQALAVVWDKIRTEHGLPAEDANGPGPCAHVKAALRLFLFGHVGGFMECDRILFAKAGIPVPDLTKELGPLAGDFDPCALVAHAVTGCRSTGTLPAIRVQYPTTSKQDGPPEHAVAAPGYVWEDAVLRGYTANLVEGLVRTVHSVGAEKCCVHVASAVRRACAAAHPKTAALEAEVLARVGLTLPEYRDEAVDRWMSIPGDDGTLKAHLDACPIANGPEHWPAVVVGPDGATRPVRVPAAKGSELKWPTPVWS
jgi:hypothetical protein